MKPRRGRGRRLRCVSRAMARNSRSHHSHHITLQSEPEPESAFAPEPLAVVKKKPAVVAKPAPTGGADGLTFSTLDFSTSALLNAQAALGPKALAKLQTKKTKHSLPKDPNAALEVLAARKERLEKLNPEQRERKEEKDRWEKVEMKASGEKVRDDEKRLKKMAKRQEKIKSKSAKAWYVIFSLPLLFGAQHLTDPALFDCAGPRARRRSPTTSRRRLRSAITTSRRASSRPRIRKRASRRNPSRSRPSPSRTRGGSRRAEEGLGLRARSERFSAR